MPLLLILKMSSLDSSWEIGKQQPIIISQRIDIRKKHWMALCAAAAGGCCAIVSLPEDPDGALLIGERSSVAATADAIKRRVRIRDWWWWCNMHNHELDRDLPYRERNSTVERRQRMDRNPMNKIKHKVAELFPSLRNWNTGPGDPEVVLLPRDQAGHRLGGIVWKPETYKTPEGQAFLGYDINTGKSIW